MRQQLQHDIEECVDAARYGGRRLLILVLNAIVQARGLTVAESVMLCAKVKVAVEPYGKF